MTIAINESVDVLTKFLHGQIVPLKIKWNERVYLIEKITSRWEFRNGDFKEYCFSVLTTGNRLMEIHLDTRDMTWNLDKIDPDPRE